MEIDEAIQLHIDWKAKLAAYLNRPDRSLNCDHVSRYDLCPLGGWIAGEGRRFSQIPEFGEMEAAHIRFHIAAGDIIRRADEGENVSEDVVLGSNSSYARASADIVRLLLELKQHVET